MTDLRRKIISSLAGSSGKNPVDIEKLRILAGANQAEVGEVLYALCATHVVNHASGMKEGKPFSAYWLTGAVTPVQPFTISSNSPHRDIQTSALPNKVKPNTSIQSREEPNMAKIPKSSRGMADAIVDIVSSHPSITVAGLIGKLRKPYPECNEKQVREMCFYLKYRFKISMDGKGTEAKLTLGSAKPAAKKPAQAKKKVQAVDVARLRNAEAQQGPLKERGRGDKQLEPMPNQVQIGGTHYKDKLIQPWDFIIRNNIGFMEGNAIKYLVRWREKGGVDDLKKARHYIDKLIETEISSASAST